jgi:hypothetical protein
MGKDQTAQLSYLQWQDLYQTEKPFQLFAQVSEDQAGQKPKMGNLIFAPGPREIMHDLRGRESNFTLDSSGFAVRQQKMPQVDLSTTEGIQEGLLPIMTDFMKQEVEGADFVLPFDWSVSVL